MCLRKGNDLISRQAAIDYCYALINAENPSDPSDEWNYSQERINQTEVILHHLEFMPSAQPEIIRCRECKHCYVDGENVRFNVCSLNHNRVQSDDWYCADAERRTDERSDR